jgi:hypothetical protein
MLQGKLAEITVGLVPEDLDEADKSSLGKKDLTNSVRAPIFREVKAERSRNRRFDRFTTLQCHPTRKESKA